MNNKKLVVHLIREQIRNKLLMNSLENLGFDCSAFSLSISEEILELAGFPQRPNELYQWYFELIDKALEETTFWNLDEMMGKWSIIVYIKLIEVKLNGTFPLHQ